MRGFCTEGIMLFPRAEYVDSWDEFYYIEMKRSAEKLVEFFKARDIQLKCFNTNDIAVRMDLDGIEWISGCPKEDLLFARNNCEDMSVIPEGNHYEALEIKARKRFPVERGLSRESRFEVLIKRDSLITRELIKQSKLIISFEQPSTAYYKVVSKAEDGRIIVKVNSNFTVSTMFAGEAIQSTLILDNKSTLGQIKEWEV